MRRKGIRVPPSNAKGLPFPTTQVSQRFLISEQLQVVARQSLFFCS
jgi:hypothetical protein